MGVDNPQAFPTSSYNPGMTLRDYFAGQALNGILAANASCGEPVDKIIAISAYIMADAMLAERKG